MANVKVPPFTEAPSTVVGGTATSVFPFDFPFWAAADILVYVDDELIDEDDYSVEGFALQDDAAVEGGYGSGAVTLDAAVSDCTVTIDRRVVGDRQTQFSRSIPLGMPALNGDLNRLTARQQDLERQKVTRPVGERAGKYLAFDGDGNEVPSAGTGSDAALRTDLADPTGASLINFKDDITGATGWTVQAALRALPVFPAAVGSLATTTLTTATLLRAFDYAIANKRPIELTGAYTVNGPITTNQTVADGALDLRFAGDVTLNVDASSTHMQYLLGAFSTAATTYLIGQTGGTLTINCNDKVARPVALVSNSGGATIAGECHVRGLRINDVKTIAATGIIAEALTITGPYAVTHVDDYVVDGVSRHADLDGTGDCKGLRFAGSKAPVYVSRSIFRNILNATQDADGLYINGLNDTGDEDSEPDCPLISIADCQFEDCQGRGIKTQVQHTEISRCQFRRQGVVSIEQGVEIDAQHGSLSVESWDIEYRLNGSTSPLGASFRPFVIQAFYDGLPKASRIGKGRLVTEAAMPNLLVLRQASSGSGTSLAPDHDVVIDGVVIEGGGSFATTVFSRSLVEFAADQIKRMTKKLTLRVENTTSQNINPLIAYTGGDGTDLSAKLEVRAVNNRTTITADGTTKTFGSLSGTALTNLGPCVFGLNPGYHQVFETWTVNWNTIPPGNEYDVNLAGLTSSNFAGAGVGTLPATGYARIKTGQGERGWYVHASREITVLDTGQRFFAINATWNQDFPNKQGAAVADAAGANPTKAEFDALLASLRAANVLAT